MPEEEIKLKSQSPIPVLIKQVETHVNTQMADAARVCGSLYSSVSKKFPDCEIAVALRDISKGKPIEKINVMVV
jgi:hypothetical protein